MTTTVSTNLNIFQAIPVTDESSSTAAPIRHDDYDDYDYDDLYEGSSDWEFDRHDDFALQYCGGGGGGGNKPDKRRKQKKNGGGGSQQHACYSSKHVRAKESLRAKRKANKGKP